MINIFETLKLNKFKLDYLNINFITLLFILLTIFTLPIKKVQSENEILNLEYLEQNKSVDYILGPGDVLSIKLSESLPFYGKSFIIEQSGLIKLPKIEKVYVKGLTVKELTDLLNRKYNELLYNPNIVLEILKPRPLKIYIDGAVESPGLYILNYSPISFLNEIVEPNSANSSFYSAPTIYDLIKKAGGVTLKADLKNIEIIRINSLTQGGGKIKANINLQSLVEFGEFSNNLGLRDGDYITVNKSTKNNLDLLGKAIKSNLNPKFIEVFVSGKVENPGTKKISHKTTLNEAISLSGGQKALPGKIYFVRISNNGSYEKRKFSFSRNASKGSYKNPFLKNGVFIIVGKGTFAKFSETMSEITSPFVEIYSVKGTLIFSQIKRENFLL